MRKAIVDETAGVTRDRHYGKCEWCGREFSVVDTGGWVVNSDDIFEEEIRKQVTVATEEADVFLGPKDAALCGEEELEEALGKLGRTKVVADPYYKDVLPAGCELISLPHLAFSGRILLNEIPDLFRLIIDL